MNRFEDFWTGLLPYYENDKIVFLYPHNTKNLAVKYSITQAYCANYHIPHTVILSDRTLKKWALQFCLPVFLGIHRNPKQKYFLKSWEGLLRYSNLSSQISTWTELDGA